ncbi:MAG: glycosyltransferase [Acidobacteriia bacterium]|nr:glycosyltransferase [Terriglobia bacterium]
MRILFVTRLIPYPLDSGRNQRSFHILQSLAAAGEVTMVCYISNEDQRAHVTHLRKYCSEVHCIAPSKWGHSRLANPSRPALWAHSLKDCLHPTRPMLLGWYESPSGKRLVAELCARGYDLVWAERLPGMHLLPPRLSTRVIVDTDDLEHRKLLHDLRQGDWRLSKPLYWLEYAKLRRLERNLLHKTPYEFTVCSLLDQRVLGDSRRVSVVPNGIEMPEEPCDIPGAPRDPVFMFLGAMDYRANIDGAQFFAAHVFPLLRREAPNARLLIVGRDPVPSIRNLHNGDSIVVTGTVPVIKPYLDQAIALVAPIRFGGGTRIKILEAMAYRKPVVSTTIGAEGLEVQAGVHLLIADDPAGLAAACLKLWREPAFSAQIARDAYDLVSRTYTWEAIGRKIEDLVCRDQYRNSADNIVHASRHT